MQHMLKLFLTSLLIFALAATACLAEDSEAQYQAYSYTTFSLRRTPSESDRGISVQKKTKNPHSGMGRRVVQGAGRQ